MSTIDDKLNEVLNITTEVMPIEVEKKESKEVVVPEDKDPDIDFETGRKNLYPIIKGYEQTKAANSDGNCPFIFCVCFLVKYSDEKNNGKKFKTVFRQSF